MASHFPPGTDAGLLAWTNNFFTGIQVSPTAVGLTAAQVTVYDDVYSEWRSKLMTAQNPATRGTLTIFVKNECKKQIIAISREFAAIVQAFPGTTNEQRVSLGLTVRKVPSPIPVPSVAPGMDLRGVTGRIVNVRIHNADAASKRAKPDGVMAAWVYSFVGENYPSDPGEWEFEGSTSTHEFQAIFPNSVAGGEQVWICAAWVNAKQQAGPVCMPITTHIQGGGIGMTAEIKIAA